MSTEEQQLKRIFKKVLQLHEEIHKESICLHSIAHLSTDLAAVAQAANTRRIKKSG